MVSYTAIVTDTDASLPLEIAVQEQIDQVPQSVVLGSESFEACAQMDDVQLFERVEREGKLPTTAAPPPGKFAAAFQKAFDEGAASVICFCVSREVSATYESARAACDLLPERQITVVDSQSLSLGLGFMVLAAAEAAQQGRSHTEILRVAENTRLRSQLFAALPTLKYLAMSGRVGHLTAGMATLLDIKPILTIKDGKLQLLERVRTWRKAKDRLIDLANQARGEKRVERLAVVHVNAAEEAARFKEALLCSLPFEGSSPRSTRACPRTPGMGCLGWGLWWVNKLTSSRHFAPHML
jgi:DegV family protein with EDD domain